MSKPKTRRDRKKERDWLEAQFFAFMQQSLKAAVDAAMKDLFRDFK